jgi:hypothetical protein
MNECIGGPVEEFAERYLNGSLAENEAEKFEEHYFSCETCHEMLVALQDIRSSLAAASRLEDASGAVTTVVSESGPAQPLRIVSRRASKPVQLGTPRRFVAWGSIAAAILVAVVLAAVALNRHPAGPQTAGNTPAAPKKIAPGTVPGSDTQPENGSRAPVQAENQNVQLASLADVQLPGYKAPELRGSEVNDPIQTAFASGMKSYTLGDCPEALAQFAHVPDGGPHGVAARLYGGLCRFKAHELSQAQNSFEAVIAAGDTPQLETAEYYLAQTMLLRSDAATARLWLRRTVSLHGDYQARAQAQLSRLVHIARQTWNVP